MFDAQKSGEYASIGKLARLFFRVPAFAIPKERHFLELKRRCDGLHSRIKIDTLDRDAVVFFWYDK